MTKLSAVIILTKIIASFMRFFHIGHGTTWPGEIALIFDKHFVGEIIKKNKHLKTIVVIGTNGKTTSVKLIKYVLEQSGRKVFSNHSGANLLNGVASTLIDHANNAGEVKFDEAVFEVDENVLPIILDEFHPAAILILNLFRDQLDRYGEVNITSAKWQNAFRYLDNRTILILNGQDAEICNLGRFAEKCPIYYFGVSKEYLTKKIIPHEADSVYCPKCREKLQFQEIAYSHIGNFHCPKCGFSNPKYIDLIGDSRIPLLGLFNRYNFSGAALLINKVFGISEENIKKYFSTYQPGFGRQEIIEYHDKKILLQLSKNPVGFNQSIELLDEAGKQKKVVLLALNDRIPDGRDISWVWDVDFEHLVKIADKIYITGDRAYDLGIRLNYAIGGKEILAHGNTISVGSKIFVINKINDALDVAVKSLGQEETLFIFPVYSAMLMIRKILIGDEFKGDEK